MTAPSFPLPGLLDDVVDLCRDAATAILEVYAGAPVAEAKADRTPVTAADRAAHRILVQGLARLTPGLPVISEEDETPRNESPPGPLFWLVDPLDGTKEFLKKTGDFTVNVALVEHGVPVLGVVQAPVTGTVWAGAPTLRGGGPGALRIDADGSRRDLSTRPADAGAVRLAASRDHGGPMVAAVEAGDAPDVVVRRVGSSLKFCLVAEGEADLYLRDGPTMHWDTAAAHCVLESAGGRVTDHRGAPLRYGVPPFRNPPFVALGDPAFDWAAFTRRFVPV